MKKIRIGNDFVLVWIITRGGQPEDLSNIIDASLNVRVFTKVKTVPFEITGNSLRIEFTPSICDMLGVYNLVFSYELPDSGLADWQRKCTIDVNAFQIVPISMMADDITEFSVTSDLLIGFKGDPGKSAYEIWLEAGNIGTIDDYLVSLKGEPFTFEDFTPDQLALLKGEKGDPFTFDDFTPEQLALLKGEKGDSAYQIWLDAGNMGTEEEFLASLKGEKGDMADVSMTINEFGDLIATINN